MINYTGRDFIPKINRVKQIILSNSIYEIETIHQILFDISQNMDLSLSAVGETESYYQIVFYTTEGNYEILFPLIREMINEKIKKVA